MLSGHVSRVSKAVLVAGTPRAFAGHPGVVLEPARQLDVAHMCQGQPYALLESKHGKPCL